MATMRVWALEEEKGIKFFRFRPSADLNLIFFARSEFDSELNYQKALRIFGIDKIFTLKQIHSNRVFYINRKNWQDKLVGDGIFTDEKNLAIGVRVADCLPIYIFSLKYKIIGIAHAGWRSTLAQISKNLVAGMISRFNIKPAELSFVFGPCIEQACYEVGLEVLSQFFNQIPGSERFFVTRQRKIYFDLKGLNRFVLTELGLTEFADLNYCTKCHPDLFYSVRRENTSKRNIAFVFLKE